MRTGAASAAAASAAAFVLVLVSAVAADSGDGHLAAGSQGRHLRFFSYSRSIMKEEEELNRTMHVQRNGTVEPLSKVMLMLRLAWGGVINTV